MKKPKILIVGDEASMARDLRRRLVKWDFTPVGVAAGGDEAMGLAEKLRPDLVIMEAGLAGGMDGIVTARLLRERFNVPAVFVTAPGDAESLRRARGMDPFGSITQPFDERELRLVIELAISKHRAELRLRDSEARYQAVTHFAHDAIITVDKTARVVSWNLGAERIFGYTQSEITAQEVTMLNPSRYRVRYQAALTRVLSGEATNVAGTSVELVGLRKDESEFPLELSVARWESADGPFVTGIIRDISARKLAEDRVRTLSQAVEQSPVTIVITDPAGNIEYVNPKFSEITGYSRAEALGRNPRMLKSGSVPASVYQELWQTIADGRVWSGELHNRKKNGDLFWEQATIAPIRDESGKTIRFVAVKEDITERKQLQANLAHAHDEALAASRLKSEFLASVSHEIRTPMNGIVGMTEMMMDTPLSFTQREMGHVIKTSAEILLVITNDILDFSKMEAGKFSIVTAGFELRSLIQETLALLAPRAQAKQLTLRCTLEAVPAGRRLGDAGRIRQVFTNLLGNAIKFTERGEIEVTVQEIAVKPGRVIARVAVRDTGIGIPVEAQPKLFQAFTQVDGSITRKFGGTGLGLAISRQLVQLMGGTIGFESELGRGSTFWFELELSTGEESPAEQPAASLDVDSPPARLHLLVADDNPLNQVVAQVMLGKMGHTADVVSNGTEVLAQLPRQEYSAVLMDCQMPELDGYKTAARIRTGEVRGVNPRIPIIALTAFAQTEDREKCLAAGMNDYLSKPVRSAELHAALSRCGLARGEISVAVVQDISAQVPGKKSSADVIDLALLETMRGLPGRAGPSLLPELIAVFMREVPPRLAELEALADVCDGARFAQVAHSFAGSCASLGGRQMRTAVLVLERSAMAEAWAEVPAQLVALREAWARLQEALTQHGLLPQ